MTGARRRLRGRVDPAAALLLGGVVLRLAFLDLRSLWSDEASTVMLTGVPLSRLAHFLVRDEIMPPLHAVLMHFWVRGFADPKTAIRLFSALCGIGALAAFRGLAERALPARARLLALFLAAVSSYWIHLAQDGRMYALLMLLSILQARVVLELTRRPTARLWALDAGLGAAGLYTHYYFAVMLAAHAAWLFWNFRREPRALAACAAAHAAAAAAFAPWLGPFAAQFRLARHAVVVNDPLTVRHLLDLLGAPFFDVTFLGLLLPGWLVPAVGAAVAAACAAALRGRPGEDPAEGRARVFALWHAAAFVALVALAEAVCGRPVTQARYFAPVAPFLCLLVARALSRTGRLAAAARVGAAALVAAGAVGYFVSGRFVDPRLGALTAALRRTDRRSALVYVETYYYLPMRYYYMPERAHFLAVEASAGADYAGLPPYDGVVGASRLRSLGPVVVMDEQGLLGGPALSLGTGAQAAALIAASPSLRRAPARPGRSSSQK